MSKILNEREFLQQLASLPREITPAQDPWPLISARISQAATTGSRTAALQFRLWPVATAASLLLILAAGLLLNSHRSEPGMVSPVRDSAMTPALRQSGSYSAGSSVAGELEFQAALREFMTLNVAAGAGEGPKPEWIEQGWGTLRQVELQLSEALRDEPDNQFLNSRMAALRARQIELLKQIALLDKASWRNTI